MPTSYSEPEHLPNLAGQLGLFVVCAGSVSLSLLVASFVFGPEAFLELCSPTSNRIGGIAFQMVVCAITIGGAVLVRGHLGFESPHACWWPLCAGAVAMLVWCGFAQPAAVYAETSEVLRAFAVPMIGAMAVGHGAGCVLGPQAVRFWHGKGEVR